MRTCSNCRKEYVEGLNEECPECGCPYDDGDFANGEEADRFLQNWYQHELEKIQELERRDYK